jgi:hypothetical protein
LKFGDLTNGEFMRGYYEVSPAVEAENQLHRAAKLLAAAHLSLDFTTIESAGAALNAAACAYYRAMYGRKKAPKKKAKP